MTTLLQRFRGSLLGLAVGDSLGAPFEGYPADFVYYASGTIDTAVENAAKGPLRYTDDTQMMLGVAEQLIALGHIEPVDLMRRFAENFDDARGYGQGASQLIEAAKRGEEWSQLAESLLPGGSFGNGAAMRVAPVGLLFHDDLKRVVREAERSAHPTHRHPLGIEGARLLATAVALAAQGLPQGFKGFYQELLDVCREDEFEWQLRAAKKLRRGDSLAQFGNSLPAHRSVVTAIACFSQMADSYEDVIQTAIVQGNDTDTLAAMAGAIAGAYLGESAIPERWQIHLETGARGKEYILELANQLHDRSRFISEGSAGEVSLS